MKRIFFLYIFFQISFSALGQSNTNKYFNKINSILLENVNPSSAIYLLEKEVGKGIQSRSNFYLHYRRNLHESYNHLRLTVEMNWEEFQIDLIEKNDSIVYRSVRHDYNKMYQNVIFNNDQVISLVSKWNEFYNATKTLEDLIQEIRLDIEFAYRCGDGAPETETYIEIKKMAKLRQLKKLDKYCQSFSIENQTYGVIGYEMVKLKSVKTKNILKHIKERNAEVTTCHGCISGIIEKPFENN
ncbi:hypothetical protein [Flammeovirga sp. SubArs3]|uniref:hypothetical protein n=1 Tax=Flammeovirga sp. SubArs3 TaxID=2995316 RepID=UPI00248CB1CD|nr:hypothetical protein [Flammeovirga sp. SubArs3]